MPQTFSEVMVKITHAYNPRRTEVRNFLEKLKNAEIDALGPIVAEHITLFTDPLTPEIGPFFSLFKKIVEALADGEMVAFCFNNMAVFKIGIETDEQGVKLVFFKTYSFDFVDGTEVSETTLATLVDINGVDAAIVTLNMLLRTLNGRDLSVKKLRVSQEEVQDSAAEV